MKLPTLEINLCNIVCDQISIPDFPAILFGSHSDDGSKYFDATTYLQKTPSQHTIEGFFQHFNFQICALADSFNLSKNQLILENSDGHYLIAGCLVFLWLSYVDKDFEAFIFESLQDLFVNGLAVSDSYLLQEFKHRFSPTVIKDLYADRQDEA